MKDMTELRERWATLWQNAAGDPNCEQKAFDSVAGNYLVGGRHYHTLEHVLWGLRRVDEIAVHEPCRKTAAGLAMFFHDAVMHFDEAHGDDEEESADFAARELIRGGVLPILVKEVRELILETAHLNPPTSLTAQVLVDADLSMLGAATKHFDRYERQVRQEWQAYDAIAYAAGRIAVLTRFLEMPRIFSTPYAFARWEGQARTNLAQSIQKLGDRL